MFPNDLLNAQMAIEATMTMTGRERFDQAQTTLIANEGHHATVDSVKLIRGAIPLVSREIAAWIATNQAKAGKGKTHTALSDLRRLNPDTLAYAALNAVHSGTLTRHTTTQIQREAGDLVHSEIIALDLQEHQDALVAQRLADLKADGLSTKGVRAGGRKVADRIQTAVDRQGSARNRKKAFRHLVSDHMDIEDWEPEKTIKVGEPLVNAVLLALPTIYEMHVSGGHKQDRANILQLTPEGLDLLSSLKEEASWMFAIRKPMVVPPRPWTAMNTGCYYDVRIARRTQLVRTFNKDHTKAVSDAITTGQMEYVLEAVNSMQSVPWAINQEVLDLVTFCFENDIPVPGLPANKRIELPARLAPEAWDALSPEQQKGTKINLRSLRTKDRGVLADRMVMLRDLSTAQELSTYARFYLPHNLDFRGRCYPIPHFSHQRADHIKSLFMFADGKPLGDLGAAWLSVHLANCGDFNKVSKQPFDDRLQWVADNEEMILNIWSAPKVHLDWLEADKPFMFLAACLDYGNWVYEGRKDSYVSRLPIALDGSNSGLQHYSASMRSQDEAALVSLVPCDIPADLYQTVADDVIVRIAEDAANGIELAQVCLDAGVGRSLVKRNVMTFAYSSERYGFKQQLLDDTMRPLNEAVLLGQLDRNPWAVTRRDDEGTDGGWAASSYLAGHIYASVTSIVHKATEGMAFFKAVASACAHEKLPLTWVSPVGLPVFHKYSVWQIKALKLFLYDRKVNVTDAGSHDKLDEDGRGVIRQVRANIRTRPLDRIDKEKARSAIAPNVIHSMDAAHLMLTVLAARKEGITDLALIHDSFGTHAGNTQRFSQIIREAFVDMYANYDPFEEVLESARASLSAEGQSRLPELPEKGSMDLEAVLDASYAFA